MGRPIFYGGPGPDLIAWPPTMEEVYFFVEKKREWHKNNPTQRVWNPNHNLVGAIGEFHFGLRFGLRPDLRVEPKRPYYIDFRTKIGTIDVKSSETAGRIHLLRQVNKPHAEILVLARVVSHSLNDVHLLGWEWDKDMIRCPTMRIDGWEDGAENHFKLPKELRPIEELEGLMNLKSYEFAPFYSKIHEKRPSSISCINRPEQTWAEFTADLVERQRKELMALGLLRTPEKS